jgi:hypothetical protein
MIITENSHHKWEQGIILLLNLDGWDLTWTGGEFEHYDAKGKTPKGFDCVMEFKLRHKYYPSKILEKFKYDKLMAENCMRFYYVFDCRGNYLYFLDNLDLPEPVLINCKQIEKIDVSKLVDKSCYMLSESQASIINKY